MTDQLRALPTAPFPAPPPFWKQFTSDNFERLKAIQNAAGKVQANAPNLPPELQNLLPPSPPAETYTVFGEEHTLSAVIPSLGDEQLFPSGSSPGRTIDHAYYLSKITKSILLNFLELSTVLSASPSYATTKLVDIKRLFLNAHHLINLYRPHQARETLILLMEKQLEEGRRELEECDSVREKVEKTLQNIGSSEQALNWIQTTSKENEPKLTMGKNHDASRLWQTIYDLE